MINITIPKPNFTRPPNNNDRLRNIVNSSFEPQNTDKIENIITHTSLDILTLDSHETNLNPLYDICGREVFLQILKLYDGKTLSIPDYKLIRQNEYLIAAYYLQKYRNYSWPQIKDILEIKDDSGYDNPAQFFSSISFAKRIKNYGIEKLERICSKLLAENISDLQWKEHFAKK